MEQKQMEKVCKVHCICLLALIFLPLEIRWPEDRKRSKYDQGVNHRHARVVQGDAVNDHVQWQHVHLGSIVMVKNHESVPAGMGCK